jgi:hypothetical protein
MAYVKVAPMLAVAARLNPTAAEAAARKVLLKAVFLLLIQYSWQSYSWQSFRKRKASSSLVHIYSRFFHCTKMNQSSRTELIIRF